MPSFSSQHDWASLLRTHLLNPDVTEDTSLALFMHLVDLNLFRWVKDNEWELMPFDSVFEDSLELQLASSLEKLCETSAGFALPFFLKDIPVPQGIPEVLQSGPADDPVSSPNPSSNLSNLQIVKKYGRQVQSFMDLENRFMAKIQGKHTDKKAARRLFNYALTQIQDKETPRPWEQLSRRRHR